MQCSQLSTYAAAIIQNDADEPSEVIVHRPRFGPECILANWKKTILEYLMQDQIKQRDRLFAELALEWSLLDVISHQRILDASAASDGGRSLADLVVEQAGLSDGDRSALDWMVDWRLSTQRPESTEQSLVSTHTGIMQKTGEPESPEFLSTHINKGAPATSTSCLVPESERYERQKFHAKGGIGQVWFTHDANFDRNVALKELLPERRSEHDLRRFLLEARVTGQLEHPGIVPVYGLHQDAETGVFYTMRFIQGKTLREEIRELHNRAMGKPSTLEMANLLNAFIAICNTIEFAHSKGVIHRDLKGQNVAVGEFGEVIVLDWGLAKIIGGAEPKLPNSAPDDDSAFDTTQDGVVVGTPAYMSPEQALADNERVGSRSDVYSLGVILYEILTGELPFKANDVSSLLHMVATTPPPRPTQVSSSVPRTLEAICLKAMAKTPEDRYASARELGDEIRRYLADEPVAALPDSVMARLGRWGRRNRTLVATAGSVLVALVVALTVGAILLSRANTRVNDQKLLAEQNAERSHANFKQAVVSINKFYTMVSETQLLDVPGMIPLRNDLLQNAFDHYSTLAAQNADNPVLKGMLADAVYRMARIQMDLGKDDEAADSIQECLAIHERLKTNGDGSELGPVSYAKVISAMCSLEMKRGNPEASMERRVQAIGILEEFLANSPDDEAGNEQLAQLLTDDSRFRYETRNISEAIAPAERALKIRRNAIVLNPTRKVHRLFLADLLSYYAVVQRDSRDIAGARKSFEESIGLYEAMQEDVKILVRHRAGLAGCYQSYGALLNFMRDPDAAAETLNKAITIRQNLVRDFPSVPDHRSNLAMSYTSLGVLYWNLREYQQALQSYQAAVDINTRLTEDFPQVFAHQDDLAAGYNNIGMTLRILQRYDEAFDAYQQCVKIRKKLMNQPSKIVYAGTQLASCYDNVGRLLRYQDDFAGSLEWQEKSINQLQQIFEHIGDDPRVLDKLHRAYRGRAETLDGLKRFAEAADDWKTSADIENGNDRTFLLMKRVRSLALGGQLAEATEEATSLMTTEILDGETLFDTAGVFAIAIVAVRNDKSLEGKVRNDQVAEFAKLAMDALNKAAAEGYFDDDEGLRDLTDDKDIDGIREFDAFKEFQAKISPDV